MVFLAEIMAASPLFGYSQRPPSGRWGPDFDCSSFIYFIAWLAGYSVGIGPRKVRFTGQMTKDFKDAGFQILPFANVGLGDLKIGDILLNLALHAEVYVGEGQVIGAQASETGAYVGAAGDQTGTEIVKQPAYIHEGGWDFVLRPPADDEEEVEEADTAEEDEGDSQMAYPYANSTWGQGNWMPNTGMGNMPRTTAPGTWMPPQQGYPQGNVGQLNGYSSAGTYGTPAMQGGWNQQMYPQGGSQRQLTHVKDLNEVRDIHVGPNECVPVFLGEGTHMAIKSADQEGFPSIRVFRLIEETEGMPQHNWMPEMGQQEHQGGYSQMPEQQPHMQQNQGVSRQEFDQLREMIANVQSAISSGFPQGNAPAAGTMDPQPNGTGSGSQQKSQSSSRNTRNS